jgi:hypothetical protein
MNNKLAEAYVQVGADMRPMEAAFKSIRGGLNRLASMRFNLPGGGILGGLGLAGAGFGVHKAVTGAADLNETISKTGVMFNDAAKTVIAASNEMAKAFGVPKREFLDGASAIGNYAKAANYSDQAAADLSVTLARLALDAASIQNIPVAQAFEKIAAALRGESEPISTLGVVMNEATVKAIGMRMGLADANGELSNSAKFSARAQAIISGLAYAQGDLARTSGGAANQSKSLGGSIQNLSDTIGATLLPAYTEMLRLLNEVTAGLQRSAEEGSGTWSKFVQSVASGISTLRVVFRNLDDYFRRFQLSMLESVARVVESVVYAGQVVYAAMKYGFENAAILAMDSVAAIQTALSNMASNFVEFGRAIGSWVASGFQDEFTANFKSITEGFKAKAPEFKLPEIDRRFSQAVKANIDAIDRKVADNEAKAQAEGAKGAGAPAINSRAVSPEAPKKQAELKSEFVGLSDFAKKIQAGALDKDKSASETARNTRASVELLRKIAAQSALTPAAVATGPA